MEISIISAFHQNDTALRLTVESILKQNNENWEWIISIPKTSIDVIVYFNELSDHRIKINVLPKSINTLNLFNSALALATGRFVCFIESGNFWEPQFLKSMYLFLNNTPFEMVYCSYDSIYKDSKHDFVETQLAENKISFSNAIYSCPLSIFCFMYDSRFIGKVFFKEGDFNYRQIMWLELLKITKFCAPIDQKLAKTYSTSARKTESKFMKFCFQYNLYREYFKYSIPKSISLIMGWLFEK